MVDDLITQGVKTLCHQGRAIYHHIYILTLPIRESRDGADVDLFHRRKKNYESSRPQAASAHFFIRNFLLERAFVFCLKPFRHGRLMSPRTLYIF